MSGTDAPDGTPRVLFVCFGNICRSPLAQAIARQQARERGLVATFESAGIGALDDGAATPEAAQVADEHGLSLSSFASRLADGDVVGRADLVLTMSADQLERVRSLGARRAYLLTEFGSGSARDVDDPIGRGLEVYRRTYDELATEIEHVLDRLERESTSSPHGRVA
jgi:protein arginine phosphatase